MRPFLYGLLADGYMYMANVHHEQGHTERTAAYLIVACLAMTMAVIRKREYDEQGV